MITDEATHDCRSITDEFAKSSGSEGSGFAGVSLDLRRLLTRIESDVERYSITRAFIHPEDRFDSRAQAAKLLFTLRVSA